MTAFLVTPTCPGFNGLRWRYRSNSIRAGAGGLAGPRARSGERDGHTAAGARAPACTCVRAIGAEPLNQRCDLRWWWGEEKKKEKTGLQLFYSSGSVPLHFRPGPLLV